MDKPFYQITDYRSIGNTSITLSVELNDDMSSMVDNAIQNHNQGDVLIESIFKEETQYCIYDNLDFFIFRSIEDIETMCKQELVKKGLYEKGIFHLLKEMIKQFVDKKYLKK